jgi:hypothetical protein
MDIRTLAEMQEPDRRSLMSYVWTAEPAQAAELAQYAIGQVKLAPAVPDTTRQAFERLRTLFAYGILCYDLYTVAGDLARMVTEQALRERFLPFYGGEPIFVCASDQCAKKVTADRWEAIPRKFLQDGKWLLRLRSGHAPIKFNGMLASLLEWARAEGLLTGQGDRLQDQVRTWFRNFAAHPTWHLQGPNDAERAITDLARIINRIWGAPSGTVVDRGAAFITWTDTAVTWGRQARTPGQPADGGNAVSVVVLAAVPNHDLGDYDALYETTSQPCDYLWGPGTPDDAAEWLRQHPQPGDQAETIDRLFLLRYHANRLYLPQAPAVAASLAGPAADGTWYLLRADTPFPAFHHQRCVLSRYSHPESSVRHDPSGECRTCPAETISSGSLPDMLTRAAQLGVDITPRPVPDVRVSMSRTPRYNTIHDGYWDIPPDDPGMVALSGPSPAS